MDKELMKILKDISSEKGGDVSSLLELITRMALVESGPEFDHTVHQIGGGPGRGLAQWETNEGKGSNRILTSIDRTKRYYESKNFEIPEWLNTAYNKVINEGTLDASTLPKDKQLLLMLGDLRYGKLDLKNYFNGEVSAKDVWLDHWWQGSKSQRANKEKAFIEKQKLYNEDSVNKMLGDIAIPGINADVFEGQENLKPFALTLQDFQKPVKNTNQYNPTNRINVSSDYKNTNSNILGNKNYFKDLNFLNENKLNQDFVKEQPATAPEGEDYNIKPVENTFNLGGAINQSLLFRNKNINRFNEGGSHSENPLGGIPQGTGENGNPNLVEQGETSYTFKDGSKYIFSHKGLGQKNSNSNTFNKGGSLGVVRNCGGKNQPPCDENYFEKIRNSRQGVRKNSDGSVSTHLMASSDNYAYPTLFQNPDGTWYELPDGKEGNWQAKKEAIKRNEFYTFNSPEEAYKFSSEGTWKGNKKDSNTFNKGGSLNGPGDKNKKNDPPTEVNYGTPEYEQAYKEGRIQGQELDEVVVTADKKTGKNILEDYPFYAKLSEQDKKYFRDSSPIGSQIRARARDGQGVTADKASAMGSQLLQGTLSAMQTPQSAMVEGVEAMRGNEYDFKSTLPGNKQRLPSDAWGYENPEGFWQNAANIGMDVVIDPLNIVGGGAARSGLQQGAKKGLISSAKQRSIDAIEEAVKASKKATKNSKKIENSLDNNFDILENWGLKEPKGRLAKAKYVPLPTKLISELKRVLGMNEKAANKWQKDWYNHPETLEKLNDAEDVFKEALKDGRVQGKNPFTEIKNRIKNKEYQGQEVKKEVIKDKGSYNGISGYDLLENQPKDKRVNLAVSNPKRESKDIISTLIHEGNHGITEGNYLIPSYYQDDMVKIFGKNATVPKRNIKTGEFESVKDYIKNPTEIYARIMQIRKDFGLKPDQEVTENMIKKFLEEIKKGKTKINKNFATDIKDTKKLTEIMNYLPAIVPAVGVGAAMQNNKEEKIK